MKKYLLLGLSLILTGYLWAQQRTISGTVRDTESGEPVPGANVVIKGTTTGTITDYKGEFSLSVPTGSALTISFVGYKPTEVAIGSMSVVNVQLALDVAELSEVVVIGYGKVESRDVTGAVSSLKTEDFNGGVISSPEQLFQGKASGVQITSNSGEPGAGVNIRIRGTASVRSGSNPLFVVDGVPLTSEDVSSGGADLGRGTSSAKNPLNFINPNDIASIDILKDASATAIYGSRGANGVVLITTKNGAGKKASLSYDNTTSISWAAKRYDLLNSSQFLQGVEDLGNDPTAVDGGYSTNWQKEVLRTSVSQNHNLAFADAYKTGDYRISLGYANQNGIVNHSGMQRLASRINWNQNLLSNRLHLGVAGTFSHVNDRAPLITDNAGFEGDLLGAMIMANPTWSANPDDQRTGDVKSPNSLLKFYDDRTKTNRALINLSASYDITKNLNFKVNTGFDRSASQRGAGFSKDIIFGNGVGGNGKASFSDKDIKSNLLETFVNYDKKFENAKFSALAGYSYQNFYTAGNNVVGWGFDTNDISKMVDNLRDAHDIIADQIDGSYQEFGNDVSSLDVKRLFPEVTSNSYDPVSTPGVATVVSNRYKYKDELQSFFGRLNYSIADKYLFTATIRADGSTKFGSNNKYGVFPSFAAAWRLSEESFVPGMFYDLKLRAGYGITGNQEIPHNVHQTRQRFADATISDGGTANEGGISDVAFANPNLQWEQTAQINLGVDFSIGKGQFYGTLDYYHKNTTDLLIQVFSAQPSPTPFVWQNLNANVINQGAEITLNYDDLVKAGAFALGLGMNVAYNHNMVTNYKGADLKTGGINGQGLTGAFAQQISNNQPLFSYYLRKFGGYDSEGVSIYPEGDVQRFIGKSALPKVYGGFNINMTYKNFSFSSSLAGQFGQYVYSNTANAYFTIGALNSGRNVTKDVLTSGESTANAPDVSTRFLDKGDFVRLQNANLSYRIPNTGEVLKSLTVFVNGQNLFLITAYRGLDPEVNVNKALDGVPSLGIDYTTYPRARTVSVGLNASF